MFAFALTILYCCSILLQCVCGVFRAHLLQSNIDGASSSPTKVPTEVFNDDYSHLAKQRGTNNYLDDSTPVPTLEDVTAFYRDIFLRSQMEVDCIIITLIYIERLIKKTEGALRPTYYNWRSLLFSCMVLSSKVWDDLSMWNCDFSKIGPSGVTFSLQRTNELEIALLSALDYKVKVGAGEYAKYYFLLRSMLCRSGLANDNLTMLNPLDAKGVGSLEKTGACCDSSIPKPLKLMRSKSFSDLENSISDKNPELGFKDSIGGLSPRVGPASKVSLEHLVRM
jgi:hypothetical protein